MKWTVACCLVLVPLVGAARGPATGSSDADLRAYLGNLQLEARLDADVTGDGRADTVYVAGDQNARVLGVIAAGNRNVPIGRRVIGEAALDLPAQLPVTLVFKRGVLSVDDLTGTDTATLAHYQYRYDNSQQRMRLFNLVCEQYSPTLRHDSSRISWNFGRGELLVEHGDVVKLDSGEEVYVYAPGQRLSRPIVPVYMEQAPNPTRLLDAERRARSLTAADQRGQSSRSP